MKLTTEKNTLQKALAQITSIVERKSTIPILANIKIWTDGNTLNMCCTDLDVEASVSFECDIQEQGSTTVSSDLFSTIVKKMPNSNLDINIAGHRLHVKSGQSEFELATLDAGDFPVMASSEYETTFEIEADELKRLFDLTSFAMSTEEARYYLNGCYLHVSDGYLKSVATDGHRLAMAQTNKFEVPKGMAGIIVPRKTVTELGKILDEGIATVSVSETKIKIVSGNTVIVSKVIDGSFPDYTRVIPNGSENVLIMDSSAFAKSADRVASMASDRMRGVKLSLISDNITLSVRSDSGSADDYIKVEYEGDTLERGFNSKYLAEVMSRVSGSVDITFGVETSTPAKIKPSDDKDALFVIMPMRV